MSESPAQGGPAAAAAAEPKPAEPTVPTEDVFTPEERAQFEEMARAEPPPADKVEPEPKPVDPADPKAAAAAEDDDDDEGEESPPAADVKPGDKPPPRRVNYNKFMRMEERAKQAETKLSALQEQNTRIDERLKLLNEALMTPKEQATAEKEDPEPDPEKDVFGWINWSRRKTAALEERLNTLNSTQQSTTDEQRIASAYIEDSRAFQAREPSFRDAYNYLMANRIAELAQYFYGVDVSEPNAQLTNDQMTRIRRAISVEERDLVTEALQAKQSPAARVYGLAKARGFRPKAAAAPGNGQQNGGKAPAPAAAARPSVADEIGRIQRGQAGSLSLSDGGGAPPSAMTPEKLASMSDEDFGAMLEGLTETQRKQVLGA